MNLIKHDCKEELKLVDLKATPARLAVLNVLEKTSTPLDISSIFLYLKKAEIKADPATIFRIINNFTEKGITRQVNFNEGKTRYELSSKEHHHLFCLNCGKIEDMSDCPVEELKKDIVSKHGFSVKSHSLEFFGICKQCQH